MPALRIYLDTDGLLELITLERPEDREHFKAIADALAMGDLLLVTSEITILEALVHAVQENDAQRQRLLREFLTPSSFIETKPVNLNVIEDALALRARYGLKSPDAIHIATGIAAGCDAFLTKDEKWAKLGLTILGPEGLAARMRGQS